MSLGRLQGDELRQTKIILVNVFFKPMFISFLYCVYLLNKIIEVCLDFV